MDEMLRLNGIMGNDIQKEGLRYGNLHKSKQ